MPLPRRASSFALFLLSIGIGLPTFAGETPTAKPVSMSETLNAQWQERVLKDLQRTRTPPHSTESAPIQKPQLSQSCNCGGFGFRGGALAVGLEDSKTQFPDPYRPFADALKECTRVKLISIESSLLLPPHLAAAFCDSLYEGYRVTNRSETADAFIAIYSFKLLSQTLEPTSEDCYLWYAAERIMEKEISIFRPSRYPPSIIIEYEGRNWLRVELFLDDGIGIVRTKDKWGKYTFSKPDALFLQSGFNNLHAIHAREPSEE